MAEKTVFITGAATGIGLALALRLDREGWRVFAGIHSSAPDELLAGASERLSLVPTNVTDPAQIASAFETVEGGVGEHGLDLLVNNAGTTAASGPMEFIDIEDFKGLMEVNFWGPIRITQSFLPLLRRSSAGRIINVTSASVHLTIPLGGAYPVSKSAYRALSSHMRMELAPFGIEVTALEPGGVETPMTSFAEEEETRCWESIPLAMRDEYRSRFMFPGGALSEGFEYGSPESFADKVYRRIVCAPKLAPVYLIGKGVGVLPWLHRLLPRVAVEWIFRRLFRVGSRRPGR